MSIVGCFYTLHQPPPSLEPPSFATPAVSKPERRNVRLDGCSSGNVPFQSAFTPEISSLIPFSSHPRKDRNSVGRECSSMGGGVEYSQSIKDWGRGKERGEREIVKEREYCR